MNNAIQRIEALCGSGSASKYAKWLLTAQTWENAGALFHSLAQAPDKDTLLNHLATLRYALVFRSLGFLPSFEPTESKGPDLRIDRDDASATVEVTRFRPMKPGPPALTWEEYRRDEFLLEPYSDLERDVNKSANKVIDKFKQAIDPCAVIAVWNDDEAIDPTDMSIAIPYIQQQRLLPAGLQIVVYGSQCIGDRQLYCFPMKAQLDARVQELANELESVRVCAAVTAVLADDRSAV